MDIHGYQWMEMSGYPLLSVNINRYLWISGDYGSVAHVGQTYSFKMIEDMYHNQNENEWHLGLSQFCQIMNIH